MNPRTMSKAAVANSRLFKRNVALNHASKHFSSVTSASRESIMSRGMNMLFSPEAKKTFNKILIPEVYPIIFFVSSAMGLVVYYGTVNAKKFSETKALNENAEVKELLVKQAKQSRS